MKRRTNYLDLWGAWFACRRRRSLLARVVEADAAELVRLEAAMNGARWEMYDSGAWRSTGSAWLAAKVCTTGGRVRLALSPASA